jgi:hypothetical protein
MQAALAKRIDELVECGWEPIATTETSASLHGRRPFNWWLFMLVVIFLPVFGGAFYVLFWLATSPDACNDASSTSGGGRVWSVDSDQNDDDVNVSRENRLDPKSRPRTR